MEEGKFGARDAWGSRAAYARKFGQNWDAKAVKNALPTRLKNDQDIIKELQTTEPWDEDAELTKYAAGLSGLNRPAAKPSSPAPAPSRSAIAASTAGGAGNLFVGSPGAADLPTTSGSTANLLGLAINQLAAIAKALAPLGDIAKSLEAMHDDRRHKTERQKTVYKSALKAIQKDKTIGKDKAVKKPVIEIKDGSDKDPEESDESGESSSSEEGSDGPGGSNFEASKAFAAEKALARQTAEKNDAKTKKKRKSSSDSQEKKDEEEAPKVRKRAASKKKKPAPAEDDDDDDASEKSGPGRESKIGLSRQPKPPKTVDV